MQQSLEEERDCSKDEFRDEGWDEGRDGGGMWTEKMMRMRMRVRFC